MSRVLLGLIIGLLVAAGAVGAAPTGDLTVKGNLTVNGSATIAPRPRRRSLPHDRLKWLPPLNVTT